MQDNLKKSNILHGSTFLSSFIFETLKMVSLMVEPSGSNDLWIPSSRVAHSAQWPNRDNPTGLTGSVGDLNLIIDAPSVFRWPRLSRHERSIGRQME